MKTMTRCFECRQYITGRPEHFGNIQLKHGNDDLRVPVCPSCYESHIENDNKGSDEECHYF